MRRFTLIKISLALAALICTAQAAYSADITNEIIAPDRNRARMTFAKDDGGAVTQLLGSLDLTWIDDLVTSPQGSTVHHKGRPHQLTDSGGFSFSIPAHAAAGAQRGAVRSTASFSLTGGNIGSGTFRQMRSEVTGRSDSHVIVDGRKYFVPENKNFLKKYGISIMALFTTGEIYDVTREFDYRILIDEVYIGSLPIYLSALYADSNKRGGGFWQRFTTTDGETVTIFYDGDEDGELNGTFWLTKRDYIDGGLHFGVGSGCSALGAPVLALLSALFVCVRVVRSRAPFGSHP